MAEEDAVLGGEMSGHYFFRDRYYGYDDAIYASLRLLEIVREAKKKGLRFSMLLEDLPDLYATEEIRLLVPEDRKREIVRELREVLEKMEVPGFKIRKSLTSMESE